MYSNRFFKYFAILLAVIVVCCVSQVVVHGGEEANYLMEKEIFESDVHSGSGRVIGTHAYIIVPKSKIQELSENDWNEFTAKVESFISKYNYFTVAFDDGTGIVYPSCMSLICYYGILDFEWDLTVKTIYLKSSSYDTFFDFINGIKSISQK